MPRSHTPRRMPHALDERPPAPDGPVPSPAPPTDEMIRERAYQIFLSRGGAPGHALDDWLQAERELKGPGKRAH